MEIEIIKKRVNIRLYFSAIYKLQNKGDKRKLLERKKSSK